MYKKSQRRIIIAVMATLCIALAGTLGVIYSASAVDMHRKNLDMLKHYAAIFAVKGAPDQTDGDPGDWVGSLPSGALPSGALPSGMERPLRIGDGDVFGVSTFYAVTCSASGEWKVADNDGHSGYSNDDLTAIAQKCVAQNKEEGTVGSLMYLVSREDDGTTLVSLIDNAILSDSMATIFRYTLIFGAIACAVMLVFSYFLSRKIIQPLAENNEQQKQFISDAGHELKTPVSVISANAEMLAREVGPSKWLDNIRAENERMARLTTDLLDLAKTEHVKPVFSAFDVSRAVTGSVLPFEGMAFERGISLDYTIAPAITMVGSEEQIGQLTAILVDNALAHCAEGGAVKVDLAAVKNKVSLRVSNTGEPIPPEKREQIFERFYRGDASRTGSGGPGRYGLGLAIARAIVQTHGDTLTVDCRDGWVIFSADISRKLPVS